MKIIKEKGNGKLIETTKDGNTVYELHENNELCITMCDENKDTALQDALDTWECFKTSGTIFI